MKFRIILTLNTPKEGMKHNFLPKTMQMITLDVHTKEKRLRWHTKFREKSHRHNFIESLSSKYVQGYSNYLYCF